MDKESKKIKKNIRNAENQIISLIFKVSIIIIALVLQATVFWFVYSVGNTLYSTKYYIYAIARLIAVLYIISRDDSSLYKTAWMLFIMFMPVLGISVFFLWGNNSMRKKKQKEIKEIESQTLNLFSNSTSVDENLKLTDKQKYNIFNYVKKYIFLEYYIIDKGKLSDKVFSILKEKVAQGVEVKIIHDSYGCINKFKKKQKEELRASGIEVYSFNPIPLFLNSYLNNRLHRKIVVIDGKISYIGGVNLADEYANLKELYGHWKDVGLRLEGEISWDYTIMFLRDLKFASKKLEVDYEKYKKLIDYTNSQDNNGIVCAISDGPNNRKNPIEAVYLQIINTAKDYVYITSPYFAISEPMLQALLNSARSGVDVRIMLPHIPDKKIVQVVTRSYYEVLLSAGVKVYEYLPGFIHSKTFVSDDSISVVGSANMDYRSMSLNYECACITYNTGAEIEIKKDFMDMVEECSTEVELKDWEKRNVFVKLVESILKTFSTMF